MTSTATEPVPLIPPPDRPRDDQDRPGRATLQDWVARVGRPFTPNCWRGSRDRSSCCPWAYVHRRLTA